MPGRVGRIYVHSKVAIVDDEWATIGSANLDGVSLLLSEHAERLGRAETRVTEANIVVLGAGAGGTSNDLPAQLRKKLWAEHLGFSPPQVRRTTTPFSCSPRRLWAAGSPCGTVSRRRS